MTRGADWYSFHARIDPIDTAGALQAALNDPQQRWYGLRRLTALAATGALVAATWNPNLHPRGRDGKFIERFGWVRWFDPKTLDWRTGWVSDINGADGTLTVRSGGEKIEFPNAKNLYSRPKPKALLDLPDPTTGKLPDKFTKVGGQGGSNPGGLYQIDGSFADGSPDITKNSKMFQSIAAFRQPGTDNTFGSNLDPSATSASFIPPEIDTVMVPRVDGTLDRYDVVQRFGNKWYRVPASGKMTDDDMMRPALEVTSDEAFGEPGTPRRQRVLADLGTVGFTRGAAFDVDDISDMVQQTGSPLPKVGDRYYVKKMNIPERARSEALANDFYELLGIPVPEVAVGADGTTISSKLVGDTVPFNSNNPQHIAAAQEGFIGDTWLSNWDVIGLSFDNVQIDQQGRAWRIDAGGALEYRAQGKPKGAMFGDQVGELDSLRNPAINPQASKVFGGVTTDRLIEQATVLQSITPQEIQDLADKHGMQHVGPVLIARRKSILDQLNIADPPNVDVNPLYPGQTQAEIHQTLTTPKAKATVYNPVEAVQQMGSPPTVAVANWNQAVKALPAATVDPSEWDQPDLLDAIWKKDGELWTYESGLEDWGSGSHRAMLRNIFTGDVKTFSLYDGEDEYLTGYDKNIDEALVDNATITRDLAVAEIVARTTSTPLGALSSFNVNHADDPDGMKYGETGLGNWKALTQAVERGRLGKDNDRPLMHSDGTLWQMTKAPGDFNDTAILVRQTPGGDDPTTNLRLLSNGNFKESGPWFMPANDTTAAVWKSKYPEKPASDLDPDGQSLAEQSKIAAQEADAADVLALLGPDGGVDIGGADDGVSDAAGLPGEETDPGMQNVVDDVLGKIQIPADMVEAWSKGLWTPGDDQATDVEAEPTSSQKTVYGVKAGLSPGIPILSTEMAISDIDQLEAALVGKNVITLPIEAHDNPDWDATNLGTANGLGTVTEVGKKQVYVPGSYSGPNGAYVSGTYKDVVALKVTKPYGGFSWVVAGEDAKFKKIVIPVETAPAPQQVVFKQNGDIYINGEKVGHYWKPYSHPAGYSHIGYQNYSGVIDGDHSLTGKPMHFQAGKQQALKNAGSSLVVPVTPKPTKPKSATKVQATEQEIKDLNYKLAVTEMAIEGIQEQLEDLANAKPAGEGNPLNDGSTPAKGDWVFSTKDGTWAQVLNPNVVGFAGKGVLSPDMIKVKIQDPVTGKWKQSNRKREQLVSVAGPGEAPFVMKTKALQTTSGDWIGPGVKVSVTGVPGAGVSPTVLDTTTDGKVKIVLADGSQKWVGLGQIPFADKPPMLKTPAGKLDQGKVDALNGELAALNDEKAQLAAVIANTVVGKPKKKKPVGTPYPGPGGATFKQPSWLAESREAKGLKNMKDGYVPTPGMILRHNDGSQYVVFETGAEWTTHKNSVYVAPIDQPFDYKWRALSTMVVDHEAMLTDTDGNAIPIVSSVEGADWAPSSGMILSKTYTKGYYAKDPLTGQSLYRKKEMTKYYIVGYDGTIYNADGSKASTSAIQPGQPIERIGYLDKSAPGGKTLTVSVQQHHNAQVGQVEYASIHDAGAPAAIPIVKPVPTPPEPPVGPLETDIGGVPHVFDKATAKWVPKSPAATPTPTVPPAPPQPAPAPPVVPTVTPNPTPTDALPVFTGKNPQGMESPHPPTSKSSAGVPVFQAQGGDPTLDVAGVPGAHSVVGAISQTLDNAKRNKQNGTRDWVGTYGLADHDVIEDMMVRSQVVRDPKGNDFVEVSFRVAPNQARKNHTTMITSSVNEAGDWESVNRNATNLVAGDQMAVRIASGGGVAPKGALRPDENATMPNATVIAPPVLIGKNAAGTLDVYRTQVMTAGGDIGFLDVEDRNGEDTLAIFQWDATKPRTSNGNKDLNPNAKDDGWTVKSKQLQWDRASSDTNVVEQHSDGVKKVEGYSTTQVGAGWTLQRDYQGAHVEYRTSTQKNSLDGQVTIRVPADDPDAQRKISEAMELVGVSKEKQLPPDKAALVKLATDKVWEQFNPTYTRGKTPNSPEEALKAIDNAVGKELGRPATMADISLRLSPDGRVQVLVSADVSRAIVKKNQITSYTHRFSGGVSEQTVNAFTGVTPGLMATTERWAHGYFFFGMSSTSDHSRDSADHLFLRMSKSTSIGSGHLVMDPVAIHRHVDYYWQPSDSFGARQSNQLNWLNSPSPGGSNELMISRRLGPEIWGNVVISEPGRTDLIKKLQAKGITKAPNGQSLEDFFVTTGSPGKLPKGDPDFGPEIPLDSLPDAVPVPAMAGV